MNLSEKSLKIDCVVIHGLTYVYLLSMKNCLIYLAKGSAHTEVNGIELVLPTYGRTRIYGYRV